jgi:hypothetical protein
MRLRIAASRPTRCSGAVVGQVRDGAPPLAQFELRDPEGSRVMVSALAAASNTGRRPNARMRGEIAQFEDADLGEVLTALKKQ